MVNQSYDGDGSISPLILKRGDLVEVLKDYSTKKRGKVLANESRDISK